MERNNGAEYQLTSAANPKPMVDTASQPRELAEDDLSQNRWHVRTVGTIRAGVDETLRSISNSTLTRSLLRGTPRRIQDLTLSPLCKYCHDLVTQVAWSASKREFTGRLWTESKGQDLAQLKLSAAENSCHFCRLRWNQLSAVPERMVDNLEWKRTVWAALEGHPGISELELDYQSGIYRFLSVPCKDIDVFPNQCIPENNNNAATWVLAKFWIDRCISGHKMCQSLSLKQPRRLPTRLIDLGPEMHTVQPHVCSSAGLPLDTRYTTLSHRWDETTITRLTLGNHQAFYQALPVPELSTVFKDAMEATKCLGIRYVWIDSLCIIQDSAEDWRHEAHTMADVYQNSYCSITALAGNHGLFADRDPKDLQACVAKPQRMGWRFREQCLYVDPKMWDDYVRNSPLFQRGWVLQEYMLAPRILHFTGRQIFWECQELRACESLPGGIPDASLDRPLVTGINYPGVQLSASQRQRIEDDPFVEHLIRWGEIVRKYSITALTFPEKDKLAAISGIARRVGPEADYLAGMWRSHLILQLLWKLDCSSTGTFKAPSWSWASMDCAVTLNEIRLKEGEKVVAEVLHAQVERASKDPASEGYTGRLRLRGSLAPVVQHSVSGMSKPSNFDYSSSLYLKFKIRIKLDYDFAQYEGAFVEHEGAFCLLLIKLCGKKDKKDKTIQYRAEGIVLERTDGEKRGEFYRRGTFDFIGHGHDDYVESFEALLALFRGELWQWQVDADHYDCMTGHAEPEFKLPAYEVVVY